MAQPNTHTHEKVRCFVCMNVTGDFFIAQNTYPVCRRHVSEAQAALYPLERLELLGLGLASPRPAAELVRAA